MNLLLPFERDKKSDLAHGEGDELQRSKIIQILMTEFEMPWRTNFGVGLSRLRHQQNNEVLSELARVYVKQALDKWMPGIELGEVEVIRDGEALVLRVGVCGEVVASLEVGG